MPRLRLSLACGDYDRTRPLRHGEVAPAGVELTYLTLPVEETFYRMVRHGEFDVAEMSLSTYVATLDSDDPPFVAIPVYPSRMFRHSAIYCRTAAGISRPSDLAGKRVGTPEVQLTAGVWMRGILDEHHGLRVDSVDHVTGGLETPGRPEKLAVAVNFPVQPAPSGSSLSTLLVEGGIDALCSPRPPSHFRAGDPRVRRLFADPEAAERDYFAATGILPIMHVVVIRRELDQRHPWLARSLLTAFEEARRLCALRQGDHSALATMSPWSALLWEREQEVLGSDAWAYGVAPAERKVLETFLRYHHDQGLSARLRTPAELFAPQTVDHFSI